MPSNSSLSRPPGLRRRSLFLVGAAGVLGAVAMAGRSGSSVQIGYPRARAGTVAARSRFLQIVAHEDDDLLFMSPGVWGTLRDGSPHLTVYLSAGESKAGMHRDKHDVNVYAAEREAGVRAAYARVLGAPNRWNRGTWRIGRVRLETFAMAAHPYVRMVFFRLPDGEDPRASLHLHTLTRLWESDHDPQTCGWTQAPPDSPFRQCVSREDVLGGLVELMERFQPTLVRAQDTAPDLRYSADHADHIAAAHFAGEALRRYTADHPERLVQDVAYRDYNIRDLAVNLGAADRAFKRHVFATYSRHDYRINAKNPHWDAYEARMAYRWPRGTTFTAPDAVYATAAGRLVTWRRVAGRWSFPQSIGDPGGVLAQGVSVAGGRAFVLRVDTGEVVMHDGRTWHSLGRPDPDTITNLPGTPLAITGRLGTVVVVRNGRGGVSARYLRRGSWSHLWADLPGCDLQEVRSPAGRKSQRYGDIQDGMAVVSTSRCFIELYAATRTQVLWWRQPKPGGDLQYAGVLPVSGPIAPLSASHTAGRTSVLFREPRTGQVRRITQTAGGWGHAELVRAATGLDGEGPILGVPKFDGRLVGGPAPLPGDSALCATGADGHLYIAPRVGSGYDSWRLAM